jgi:hypothetical protein
MPQMHSPQHDLAFHPVCIKKIYKQLKVLSNIMLLTRVTWGKEGDRGNSVHEHPTTKKANGGGNMKYSKDDKPS